MAQIASEPKTLNDLPAEMVCEVLRWLSLTDLVSLKMTSKRYLQIVSDFKVKKLIVDDHETSDSNGYCPPTLFIHQFTRSALSHLQQLTIDACPNHFDFNQLNSLDRLVQLKIDGQLLRSEEVHLDLPELKQLEVTFNRTCKLRINSTKLEKLTYYSYSNLLQVEHPETVIYLDSNLSGELLRSFRNVRYLRSSKLRIFEELTLSDLENFRDLKEIAFIGSLENVYYSRAITNIDELSPFLERFMSKKKVSGRTDLKVLFLSFELVDHKPIDDYRFLKIFYDYEEYSEYCDELYVPFYWFDLHIVNYDQLIGTAPFRDVSYLKLMRLFGGRIPDDFFSKFAGIESVQVSQLYADEEHLLWFLQSLPSLKEFQTDVANLSESFFRHLAENCSGRLQSIILGEMDLKKLQNIDFPSEFRALDFLELYMELSLEEIRWLLNMSWSRKSLFHLSFKYVDPKSKNPFPVSYDVKRTSDSREAFLCLGKNYKDDDYQNLKSCPVAYLSELTEYFEKL